MTHAEKYDIVLGVDYIPYLANEPVMHVVERNGYRVETGAVLERDGCYYVTAEVFDGNRMIRGFYRRLCAQASAANAERELAEDVVRMSSQAE